MWIETLRVERLRSVSAAELTLSPGVNLILGPNGAGKTSLLEAAFLLSYGRSFRRGGREALVQRGASGFRVFAKLQRADGSITRLGLERQGTSWQGRMDEAPVARLSDLFAACAVCCFEPGSHELISGPSDERRAFLDWGVFHVEPGFIEAWRRYSRALKQRNLLLKRAVPDAELDPWDAELARSGAEMQRFRAAYVRRLAERFEAAAAQLLPELGRGTLLLEAGWDEAASLEESLAVSRDKDRQRQTTTVGPHRADWRIRFENAPHRHHLSRGQEKLTALAAVLAQAEVHADAKGEWPVMALDDLPSELDHAHQAQALDTLLAAGAQLLSTATEVPLGCAARLGPHATFHVEHGAVRRG